MKKILVPTDFSANSISGVRFAIQWASQQKLELVFIHVLHLLRPTQWSDAYFKKYAADQEQECLDKISQLIAGIYSKMAITPGKYKCIVQKGISADISLMDYCRENPGIDCICLSTRGAGKFKKILGTHTGNLITKAGVAVLAIPKNYRAANISHVLYATDFKNYTQEFAKVVQFAKPLKAMVEILHITWPNEISLEKSTMEAVFKKQFKYPLQLHMVKADASFSVVEQLQKQIALLKPSVVIMFTEQRKTFFQRLFLSSKSEELSFESKVPLLVFNKHNQG